MENREKIIECALELFFHRGYDAVGIQEICQSAGITKPTLYHYFGSKHGLLETLLEERLSGEIGKLEQYVEGMNSADISYIGMEQILYRYADGLIDFANRNYKVYMVFMSMSYSAKDSETHQTVLPYLSRMYGAAVQLFTRSSGLLGNMNGRQEQFAIGFLGLINQYILLVENRDKAEEQILVSEEKKRSLVHQFMHGIYS